jgi:hypothetical protein
MQYTMIHLLLDQAIEITIPQFKHLREPKVVGKTEVDCAMQYWIVYSIKRGALYKIQISL